MECTRRLLGRFGALLFVGAMTVLGVHLAIDLSDNLAGAMVLA